MATNIWKIQGYSGWPGELALQCEKCLIDPEGKGLEPETMHCPELALEGLSLMTSVSPAVT